MRYLDCFEIVKLLELFIKSTENEPEHVQNALYTRTESRSKVETDDTNRNESFTTDLWHQIRELVYDAS